MEYLLFLPLTICLPAFLWLWRKSVDTLEENRWLKSEIEYQRGRYEALKRLHASLAKAKAAERDREGGEA